jgi:hypothetical protein
MQMNQFCVAPPARWINAPSARLRRIHSLFREQSYDALSRQDAARVADLGAYRARIGHDQAHRVDLTDPSPRLSSSIASTNPVSVDPPMSNETNAQISVGSKT